MKVMNSEILPLARTLARELSPEEVTQIGGGWPPFPPPPSTGGNSEDGTTNGPRHSDLDLLQ